MYRNTVTEIIRRTELKKYATYHKKTYEYTEPDDLGTRKLEAGVEGFFLEVIVDTDVLGYEISCILIFEEKLYQPLTSQVPMVISDFKSNDYPSEDFFEKDDSQTSSGRSSASLHS